MKAIVVCSGGLDSVTLAHKLAADQAVVRLLSFDYGQRHKIELDRARACAGRLGVPHDVVDITAIGALLTGSALIGSALIGSGLADGLPVPDGHYAEATMRITVVPNRNAIMLTIAFGRAVAAQADAVAVAVHGGDHFIYPDCRPGFIDAFAAMQRHALDGVAAVALHAPFLHGDKAAIVREGARLGVPFADTWSCYKGGAMHCGRCGTCVERREAFDLAEIADPTPYQDADFWREAVRDHQARRGGPR